MEKAAKYYEEQTEDIKQVFNKNGVEHTVKIMLFEYSKALQKENQELREVAQRFINIQEGTNGDIGTETYKQFKQLLTKNN